MGDAAEDALDYEMRAAGVWPEYSRPHKTWGQGWNVSAKPPEAPRHGELWTAAEERNLRSMFDKGYGVDIMAKTIGRKESGIIARLEKLGLVALGTQPHELVELTAKKESNFVNLNHVITLLQKGYTTVSVTFLSPARSDSSSQTYTYKISTAMRSGLNVGDQLVVPARGDLKVVWVSEIHETPQIDVKAPYALQWVVCRVDRTAYDDQLRREAEAIRLIEKSERRKAQEEAAKAFLDAVGDSSELLKLLNGE